MSNINNTYFYNELTKKYIVIVGSLFDGYRILKDGKFIKIPVSYGGKDKMIQRYLRRDISFKGIQMTLPRIAYEFKHFYYDNERKLNRIYEFASGNDSMSKITQYTPVPYNIDIDVSVLSNKINDSNQILEQLIPIFTPDIKIKSNLIPENNIILDISLCLNNVYTQDSYQGLLTDERFITYVLQFTLKGFYFREMKTKKIISEEILRFYDYDDPIIPQFTETITANTIIQ